MIMQEIPFSDNIYFLSEGPRLISIYIVQKGCAIHMTEKKKILVRAKFDK